MTLTKDEFQQIVDAQRDTMTLELTQDELEELVEALRGYIRKWPEAKPLFQKLSAVAAWRRRTNGATMTWADWNACT